MYMYTVLVASYMTERTDFHFVAPRPQTIKYLEDSQVLSISCSACYKDIYTIILLKSVAVSKLQAAILARLSREMSQTIRID